MTVNISLGRGATVVLSDLYAVKEALLKQPEVQVRGQIRVGYSVLDVCGRRIFYLHRSLRFFAVLTQIHA